MKGRKPTPTHLKLLAGNPGKRKVNRDEPKPATGAPPRPVFFNDDEAAAWDYIVGELSKMGILASSDQALLLSYAHFLGLIARLRREMNESGEGDTITAPSGRIAPNPRLKLINDAVTTLIRISAELGLSPTSRTRLHVEKPAPRSKRELLGLGMSDAEYEKMKNYELLGLN